MEQAIEAAISQGRLTKEIRLDWAATECQLSNCFEDNVDFEPWSVCSPPCSLADDESLKQLAGAIEAGAELQMLDLSHQALGKAGVYALSRALGGSKLQKLRLDHCTFQDGALQHLAVFLERSPPSLRVLSLMNATIRGKKTRLLDEREASRLALALETNTHLEELVLKDNGISRFDFDTLRASSLTTLDLRGNVNIASIHLWLEHLRCHPGHRIDVQLDNQMQISHEDLMEYHRLIKLSDDEKDLERDQCVKRREVDRKMVNLLMIAVWLLVLLAAALVLWYTRRLSAARVQKDLAVAERRVKDSETARGLAPVCTDGRGLWDPELWGKYETTCKSLPGVYQAMKLVEGLPQFRQKVLVARIYVKLHLFYTEQLAAEQMHPQCTDLINEIQKAVEKTNDEYRMDRKWQEFKDLLNKWLTGWLQQEAGANRLPIDEQRRQVALEQSQRHSLQPPELGLQNASRLVRAVCQPAVDACYYLLMGTWRIIILGVGLWWGGAIAQGAERREDRLLGEWLGWFNSWSNWATQSIFDIFFTTLLGETQAAFFQSLMLPLACVLGLGLSGLYTIFFEVLVSPVPRFVRARRAFSQVREAQKLLINWLSID